MISREKYLKCVLNKSKKKKEREKPKPNISV